MQMEPCDEHTLIPVRMLGCRMATVCLLGAVLLGLDAVLLLKGVDARAEGGAGPGARKLMTARDGRHAPPAYCHDRWRDRPWGDARVKVTVALRECLVGVGFFFFQAEDGIRDLIVTGVQTCALPI